MSEIKESVDDEIKSRFPKEKKNYWKVIKNILKIIKKK